MIIIQRCRKPAQLTAAKFCVMNMQKFGNVKKNKLFFEFTNFQNINRILLY